MTLEPSSTPEREPDITLQRLREFLGAPATELDARIQPYVESAAVLAAFELAALQPARRTNTAREEALDALLPICEPAAQVGRPGLWSLGLPARRSTLEKMATRDRMREALEANPDRLDVPLQRAIDGIILQKLKPVDQLSRDELAALLTACDWLAGILDALPERSRVQERMSRVDLVAPMERLAGSAFVGRDAELAQMSDYVFGAPPEAPLFVFGTGGVGKSTLLARFLLKDVAPKDVPLAYLDIDRPTIRPEQPLTLLLDAIAQFRPQVDWTPAAVDPLVKEIVGLIGRQEAGRHFESAGFGWDWILDLFAHGFQKQLRNRHAVLAVDTIEEAQFLGRDVVWGLMDFVFALERTVPQLRIILSGRTLPEEYLSKAFPNAAAANQADDWLSQLPLPGRPINLGVLDAASAVELLVLSLKELEIAPLTPTEIDDVIAIVSRNPMCLKLAARVLRDEGVDEVRADRVRFLAKLKTEKIQGLLYARILRHVHGGEDLRRVAYPGLAVRRITPEVIREVLAEPCDLKLTTERNEHVIFDALRNEAALVDVDPLDGSLVHRTDVRRVMLQDLTDQIDAALLGRIDSNAVSYYEARQGPVNRGEEIYHRLRRGDAAETLEPRWIPEARVRLKTALDDIPAAQRLWLASKLGVTLDAAARQAADVEVWEGQAARSADRYLQSGSAEQALTVLNERIDRTPRSPLFALEAEAYRFLRQFDKALEAANRGVEAASRAGAVDLVLDLLLKMAVIEETRNKMVGAEMLVDRAAAMLHDTSNRMLRLRVAVSKLRAQRQLRPANRTERATLREEALQMLDEEMLRRLRDQPVLLREVAAELSKQDARIAALAIETLGIEVETDAQATALAKAIVNLAPAGSKEAARASAKDKPENVVTLGTKMFKESKFDPGVIRKWATETVTERDVRRIGSTIAEIDIGGKVLSGFRAYFRVGVERALGGSRTASVRVARETGMGRKKG
jgi:hypothetical protein